MSWLASGNGGEGWGRGLGVRGGGVGAERGVVRLTGTMGEEWVGWWGGVWLLGGCGCFVLKNAASAVICAW